MKPLRLAVLSAALASGAQAMAQTPAVSAAPLGSVVRADDYPAEAIRKNEQGTVRFRLDVGAKGEVRGCSILVSSGSTSLDEATCRIMSERARFRPALDKAGRAMPSSVDQNVVWRLEEGRSPPPRLKALMNLWTSCLVGETAKRIPSQMPTDQLPDEAFRACAQNEALVSAETRSAPGPDTQPSSGLDEAKRTLRPRIIEEADKVRKMLETAAEPQ